MKVRCNPLIIIVAAIVGVIAASFIFAQWGNSNEILKRTAVMSIMISLITVSTVLMICLILLSKYTVLSFYLYSVNYVMFFNIA